MQGYQSHRDKILKQIRREHFLRVLKSERENCYQINEKMEREDFLKIYPVVSEQNYEKYKNSLGMFAANQNYSYQLCVFAPLVHDYFIQHFDDSDSVVILKFITQFQEIQIPQTYQFAQCLTKLAQKRLFDSILIVSNLLYYPKYQNLLIQKLLLTNYIEKVQQLLKYNIKFQSFERQKYNLANIMYSQILCHIIFSQPELKNNYLLSMIQKLKYYLQYQQTKWCILQSFSTLRVRIKGHIKYSKLLLKEFQQFMISERHTGLIYILDLLIYCAKSEIFSQNQKIINIIIDPIAKFQRIQSELINKSLQCLLLYLTDTQLNISDEVIQNLFSIFIQSQANKNIQQIVLSIFNLLSCNDFLAVFESYQKRNQIIYQLVGLLGINESQITTLMILSRILNAEIIGVKQQLEANGGKKLLNQLYDQCKNPQLCSEIEEVLNQL